MYLDIWNGFSGSIRWAVHFWLVLLVRINPLLILRNTFLLLLQERPKLRQSFPHDLLQLWSNDLSLLVLGRGGTLTVPGRELVHSLKVEESLQTRDVVINQCEVLIVDSTANLYKLGRRERKEGGGGGREREGKREGEEREEAGRETRKEGGRGKDRFK